MRLKTLDLRLRAAYDLVDACERYADIGADHGLLPLHLVAGGKVERPIVSDISAPALQKARDIFARHGLEADFRVADGLKALDVPMDFISILGMGGDTLLSILNAGKEKLGNATLVLSPHTHLKRVRQGLNALGYVFEKEALVFEGRRFYVLLRVKKGEAAYTEKEYALGPCFLKEPPPLFIEYLLWQKKVLILSGSEDIKFVEEAIECLSKN